MPTARTVRTCNLLMASPFRWNLRTIHFTQFGAALDVEILDLKKGESVRIWLRMDERRLTESTCSDRLIQTEAQAEIPLNHENTKRRKHEKNIFQIQASNSYFHFVRVFVLSCFRDSMESCLRFPFCIYFL